MSGLAVVLACQAIRAGSLMLCSLFRCVALVRGVHVGVVICDLHWDQLVNHLGDSDGLDFARLTNVTNGPISYQIHTYEVDNGSIDDLIYEAWGEA